MYSPKYNSGDIVGELTLVYRFMKRIKSGKMNAFWHCICSCGIEKDIMEQNLATIKSCGHIRKTKDRSEDLTGNVYFWLTVKSKAPSRISKSGRKIARSLCICECGNEVVADNAELKKGTIKSCGCHKYDYIKEKYDLTGKIMNSIFIKEKIDSAKYINNKNKKTSMARYKCLCLECFSEFEAFGSALRRGQISCGCLNSKGEYETAKILKEYNISYESSYSYDDLLSPFGWPVFFDFALKDKEKVVALIEYQGIQHYVPQTDHFGDYQREITDPLKKEYCKRNNIKLFEIKYDENIRTAVNNILSKVYVNFVPSSQETA